MTRQIERALQAEVMLRLRYYPVIALPIPNSMFIPTRSPAEKEMTRRIVYQMKNSGMLVAGAPDLAVLWRGGAGFIELKRPASTDLLGNKRAAGRPSERQVEFAERCAELHINHAYCSSWDEVRAALTGWGAPV
jgi:hypothetical protein